MTRREIKVVTCDHCAHDQEQERIAATSIVIKMDRDAPKRVDLCEDHESLWRKIQAIARTRGVSGG